MYLLMPLRGGVKMYVKQLSKNEIKALDQRFERIKELQEEGICFSCYNFSQEIYSLMRA
jgi:hypothetical protein